MKIIAHRGASGYAPENSIEAIKMAIDMKADFVEIDVRRTRDGKLVVIHDGKVDRVTNGTGYISRLSLKQVRKFRLPNGEPIPTFEEVLDLLKASEHTKFRIHIKWAGFEHKVLNAIVAKGVWDRVRILGSSIVLKTVIPLQKYLGYDIELGLAGRQQLLKVAKELGVVEVSPHISTLTRKYVERAHQMNIEVYTWLIDDLKSLKRAIELNVDGIITRYPDILSKYSKELKEFM